MADRLTLFAPWATRPLGGSVADELGVALGEIEERDFEDGEHKVRPLTAVRGSDVYVVHSLYGDDQESPDEKLCRLLFFLGTLRDAGAARLTAVVPYLCYARKDRRTQSQDPVTTRYVAQLLEAVGVDRAVALDVHNVAAFQNAFRIPSEHLEAGPLLAERLVPVLHGRAALVLSPDPGGVKRSDTFRRLLSSALGVEIPGGFAEKQRTNEGVTGDALAGDVRGKTVVIVDDLISTGTTVLRAARACRARGAERVYAATTHGLFAGGAEALFEDGVLDGLFVTNSVPPFRLSEAHQARLTMLDIAPLLAKAVRSLHEEEP